MGVREKEVSQEAKGAALDSPWLADGNEVKVKLPSGGCQRGYQAFSGNL